MMELGLLGVTTGVDNPGQKQIFYASPGGTEVAARRPINTAKNLILFVFMSWGGLIRRINVYMYRDSACR